MKKLLLISNSVTHGKGYLDHCANDMMDFLSETKEVLFVPYALKDYDKYASVVKERFQQLGIAVTSIHEAKNPKQAVLKAQAIFIGGGNTFRLLNRLYEKGLLEAIQTRVAKGMKYIGSSAGSNVSCPTIKTTNDMPIAYPPSFDALNLIPFQINPHYIDTDPNSKHMGEAREQRIKEYLEENDTTVVGLREGTWLRIENGKVELKGNLGIRIFEKGKKPKEYPPKSTLNFLL